MKYNNSFESLFCNDPKLLIYTSITIIYAQGTNYLIVTLYLAIQLVLLLLVPPLIRNIADVVKTIDKYT